MPEIGKKDHFIPFFLQQKVQKDRGEVPADGSPGRRHASQRRRAAADAFTSPQLEDLIWKTSQTIVDLQKQIQRGEETYYEETQTHGSSLFRGFETYIDARDVGTSSAPSSTSRRMPGDYRWFSSSCSNISRHMKQRPFVPVAPLLAPKSPPPTQNSSGGEQSKTAEPLSGQKRPAPPADLDAADPHPAKERRADESQSPQQEQDVRTPKEDKSNKGGRSSVPVPKSSEPRRRTSRKRKA